MGVLKGKRVRKPTNNSPSDIITTTMETRAFAGSGQVPGWGLLGSCPGLNRAALFAAGYSRYDKSLHINHPLLTNIESNGKIPVSRASALFLLL